MANTAGTYYAYLKTLYRKAKRPLVLLPPPITTNHRLNKPHLLDATDLVQSHSTDILYLDPPYNERDYGSYYHLPETVAVGDDPAVHGRSGIRLAPTSSSAFCRKSTATDALRVLVEGATCKCLLLHYATDGLVAHRDILRMLRTKGRSTWTTWQIRKYSAQPEGGMTSTAAHRLYTCIVG